MWKSKRSLGVILIGLGLATVATVATVEGCGGDDDTGATPMGGAGSGAVAGTFASGAGGAGGSAGAGAAGMGCGTESFTAIYNDIFSDKIYMCSNAACHGRMTGQTGSVGNLELMTKDIAYADLVGVASDGVLCGDMPRTRVKPGDAAGSLLVQKLRAATVMCGSLMPITGGMITDPQLARITAWINGGACNN